VLQGFKGNVLYQDNTSTGEGNATTESFSYDDSGNLIQDDTYYYEYNGYNQLYRVRIDNASGTILETYYYDESGQRAIKVHFFTGGTNETTMYFGDMVRVINQSGMFDSVYYYANDKLVAERKNNSQMLFYHPDLLGSTTLITNSSSGKVEDTLYQPFGQIYSGGTKSRYSFSGKELDDTGLMDFGNRYYKSDVPLFTQPDTLLPAIYDPQQLNRFSYVKNNPYRYIDPSGNAVCDASNGCTQLRGLGGTQTWGALTPEDSDPQGEYQYYDSMYTRYDSPFSNNAPRGKNQEGNQLVADIYISIGLSMSGTKVTTPETKIQNIANDLGKSSNRFEGTAKHTELASRLEGTPDVYTEVTAKGNTVVNRGTKGASRADVVISGSKDMSKVGTSFNANEVSVFEYKSGNSGMSTSQSCSYSSNFGSPATVIKPVPKPTLFQSIKNFFSSIFK
jgi:RHS repeat-associated protein